MELSIKNACSTGRRQTKYEASQDTPPYSATFTMYRLPDIQYGFCEQAGV